MPTEEEVAEMEREGNRHGRVRGVIEMVIGIVVFSFGVLSLIFSGRLSHFTTVNLLFGIVTFGVGLSRILKP